MPRHLFATLASASCLALFCFQSAEAQTRPFFIKGGGTAAFIPFDPDSDEDGTATHVSTGNATYLGGHSGEGAIELLAFTSANTATFQSAKPFEFSSKHLRLAFDYGRADKGVPAGVVTLYPAGPSHPGKVVAIFDAIFTLSSATPLTKAGIKKAEKVGDARFRMIATTEPFVFGVKVPVAYTWAGEGTLTFAK
jgi:hypothetical protein